MKLRSRKQQPFRLLDLPVELQLKVYERYLEGVEFRVHEKTGSPIEFGIQRSLGLDIELTSRQVCADVRRMRRECTNQTLIMNERWIDRRVRILVANPKYHWIRDHISQLEVQTSDTLFDNKSPELLACSSLGLLIHACSFLREISLHITVNPLRNFLNSRTPMYYSNEIRAQFTKFMYEVDVPRYEDTAVGLQNLANVLISRHTDGRVQMFVTVKYADKDKEAVLTKFTRHIISANEIKLKFKEASCAYGHGRWSDGMDNPLIELS